MTNQKYLRVCYFGTYRKNYSRNQMMIAGLRLNGVTVVECHQVLWHGIEDRVRVASGEWRHPSFWWRILNAYLRLLIKYFHVGEYDVMVVGYPGQFDIYLARLLTWLKRKPLVWDVFMSIYLISLERGLNKGSKFTTKLLRKIENLALKQPDMLILDTDEYAGWFNQNYGIHPKRFRLVPTGADDRIFFPINPKSGRDDEYHILYYGTFIPNHGIAYILEAAKLLASKKDILFKFIGNGPELGMAQRYAQEHKLQNVRFFGWMKPEDLNRCINDADICLGSFGETPQSVMTIQNKIFQNMAVGKPVITGDSPAIRQVCTHGKDIYLCKRASGSSLSEAIITLLNNSTLMNELGINAYQLYRKEYDLAHNGKRFYSYLLEAVQ